jgi:hypothetical protein
LCVLNSPKISTFREACRPVLFDSTHSDVVIVGSLRQNQKVTARSNRHAMEECHVETQSR